VHFTNLNWIELSLFLTSSSSQALVSFFLFKPSYFLQVREKLQRKLDDAQVVYLFEFLSFKEKILVSQQFYFFKVTKNFFPPFSEHAS